MNGEGNDSAWTLDIALHEHEQQGCVRFRCGASSMNAAWKPNHIAIGHLTDTSGSHPRDEELVCKVDTLHRERRQLLGGK